MNVILIMLIFYFADALSMPFSIASNPSDSSRPKLRSWTLGLPIWIPGFRGKFTKGGTEIIGEPKEEDIFDLLFSSKIGLDFYLVGMVQYKWNSWKFHLDIFDGTIKNSTTFTLTDNTVTETTLQLTMPRFFSAYDFLHDSNPLGPITHWGVYFGGRLYYLDLEVILPDKMELVNTKETWITLFIGTELSVRILKKVHLLFLGDIGGFTGRNKLTAFGQAHLDYRIRDFLSVYIGYSALHISRGLDNPLDLQFEGNLFGPALGIAFYF